MNRYSAKLLFQFRVGAGASASVRRICEERIILVRSDSARSAVAIAHRIGSSAEHHYVNSDGRDVYFEMIGIVELIRLGLECGEEEVWYSLFERLRPMERKDFFIPNKAELAAVQEESLKKRSKKPMKRGREEKNA